MLFQPPITMIMQLPPNSGVRSYTDEHANSRNFTVAKLLQAHDHLLPCAIVHTLAFKYFLHTPIEVWKNFILSSINKKKKEERKSLFVVYLSFYCTDHSQGRD